MHSSGFCTWCTFYIIGTSQHLLVKCTLQVCAYLEFFTLLGRPNIYLKNALFRHAHMLYCLHCWDIPSFAWIMHSSGMHTWCIFYIVGMSQQFHEKMHSSGVHTSCIFYVVGTSQYLLKKCTLQACTQVFFFYVVGTSQYLLGKCTLFSFAHIRASFGILGTSQHSLQICTTESQEW